MSELELIDTDYGLASPPSPGSPTSPGHSVRKLDCKKSVRPYRTNDEYLYAMREDLAAWLNDLYSSNFTAENLLERLQDGAFLCRHANNVKSHIQTTENRQDVPNVMFR